MSKKRVVAKALTTFRSDPRSKLVTHQWIPGYLTKPGFEWPAS